MLSQSRPARPLSPRVRNRVYVPLNRRRRRGGQPGNANALKLGRYTSAARASRRAVWLFLEDVRAAIAAARRFERPHVHTVDVIQGERPPGGGGWAEFEGAEFP